MAEKKEEKCLEDNLTLAEKLKKMAEVDIRTVDKETLVDIKDVEIDKTLPKQERVMEYIRQIKNPYCYLCNGVIVKISFSGNRKLEDCISDCISMQS